VLAGPLLSIKGDMRVPKVSSRDEDARKWGDIGPVAVEVLQTAMGSGV